VATTIATIVSSARVHLIETTAGFWTDAELVEHAIAGIKDLWGVINDNFQNYFLTIDETNVSLPANTFAVTGVPADVFRVHAIEPRSLSAAVNCVFAHRDYTHADFLSARAMDAIDPAGALLFWDIINAGAPVAAPSIYVAPKVTSALTLRLVYVPTLATLTSASNNPIPGESDNAIKAWIVAYARAKEREDRAPDDGWLAIYATEKTNLLVRLTPRQVADDQVAEAVFEAYWE
jgi:hypothetical protein